MKRDRAVLCHGVASDHTPIIKRDDFSAGDEQVVLWQSISELQQAYLKVRHEWVHESGLTVETETDIPNEREQRTIWGILELRRVILSQGIDGTGVWRVRSWINGTQTVDAAFVVHGGEAPGLHGHFLDVIV